MIVSFDGDSLTFHKNAMQEHFRKNAVFWYGNEDTIHLRDSSALLAAALSRMSLHVPRDAARTKTEGKVIR